MITFAGEPEAVAKAVVLGAGKAAELIDLRKHKGEHPRIGATDVIPLKGISYLSAKNQVLHLWTGPARKEDT